MYNKLYINMKIQLQTRGMNAQILVLQIRSTKSNCNKKNNKLISIVARIINKALLNHYYDLFMTTDTLISNNTKQLNSYQRRLSPFCVITMPATTQH